MTGRAIAPALVSASLLLVPLGAYTAAYLSLGMNATTQDGSSVIRIYRSKPLMILFTPAATVDGWMTRRDVQAAY
jgi:hypothetical protein